MTAARLPAVAALIICGAAGHAFAQQRDRSSFDPTDFIARARRATERFKDIDVAVAENYVKIGPDFPAMGEHWVKGELIMKGELDPARPAIVTYATLNGVPTLTGAVYAITLPAGESPPPIPQGAQWHDHVGTIDEESLLFGHDRGAGGEELRLVVMHAWIWVPNPSGTFSTDNWALPFARLGLRAPLVIPADAARAVSLLSGSADYFARLFASVGELDEAESIRVSNILERQRGDVEKWWRSRGESSEVSADDLARLGALWTLLEQDVEHGVSSTAAQRLARLRGHR
jgi:hypothetical protein